jgi:hypothetical protein
MENTMACCGRKSSTPPPGGIKINRITSYRAAPRLAKPTGLKGIMVRRCPKCGANLNRFAKLEGKKMTYFWSCSKAGCKYQEKS